MHACIDVLLLKIEETLFCLGSSSTSNPVTGCILINEMDSHVARFENLFLSENLFKMTSCSERKRVVSKEKRLDALKRMDIEVKALNLLPHLLVLVRAQ